MSLRDPLGRSIDPASAADRDDAEYLELGFADFASYVLTDTLPGLWSMTVESDKANPKPSEYVAYASFDSPATLRIATDREWYRPGDVATITATISDSEATSKIREVMVSIYPPDRSPLTLPLSHVPEAKTVGSQVYEASYTIPGDGGYYVLLCRAVGQRGAEVMERGAEAIIGVSTLAARLLPPPTLAIEEANGGRISERAVAKIGVSVHTEGDYLVSVTLKDGGGRRVATVAHPTHLGPGDQVVTVPLGALARSEASQDYRLGDIALLDVSGAAVLLDEILDLRLR